MTTYKLIDAFNPKPPVSTTGNESIRTDVWLSLQTRYAQMLVRGRQLKGKPPIVGLLRFADALRVIWHAAAANDPYADWWLIKIHDRIASLNNLLDERLSQFESLTESTPAFQIAPVEAKEPFRIKISFATPYAYRAADLMTRFDRFATQALVCKHLGYIDTKSSKVMIHAAARKLRGLFALALGYRHLGIDRSDPLSFAPVAATARLYMGEPPKEVLEGTRRAKLAPEIKRSTFSSVPPIVESIEEIEEFAA